MAESTQDAVPDSMVGNFAHLQIPGLRFSHPIIENPIDEENNAGGDTEEREEQVLCLSHPTIEDPNDGENNAVGDTEEREEKQKDIVSSSDPVAESLVIPPWVAARNWRSGNGNSPANLSSEQEKQKSEQEKKALPPKFLRTEHLKDLEIGAVLTLPPFEVARHYPSACEIERGAYKHPVVILGYRSVDRRYLYVAICTTFGRFTPGEISFKSGDKNLGEIHIRICEGGRDHLDGATGILNRNAVLDGENPLFRRRTWLKLYPMEIHFEQLATIGWLDNKIEYLSLGVTDEVMQGLMKVHSNKGKSTGIIVSKLYDAWLEERNKRRDEEMKKKEELTKKATLQKRLRQPLFSPKNSALGFLSKKPNENPSRSSTVETQQPSLEQVISPGKAKTHSFENGEFSRSSPGGRSGDDDIKGGISPSSSTSSRRSTRKRSGEMLPQRSPAAYGREDSENKEVTTSPSTSKIGISSAVSTERWSEMEKDAEGKSRANPRTNVHGPKKYAGRDLPAPQSQLPSRRDTFPPTADSKWGRRSEAQETDNHHHGVANGNHQYSRQREWRASFSNLHPAISATNGMASSPISNQRPTPTIPVTHGIPSRTGEPYIPPNKRNSCLFPSQAMADSLCLAPSNLQKERGGQTGEKKE